MSFTDGFTKLALNALKARQLAKKHKLLPEGQWKWALRNLRKGKSRQDLGSAPDSLVKAIRRVGGDEVEAGAFWGKGAKGGLGQVGRGTELGYQQQSVPRFMKDVFPHVMEAMTEPAGRKMKSLGKANAAYKNIMKERAHLNTIHSHPTSTKKALLFEKDLIKSYREMRTGKDNPLAHMPDSRVKRIATETMGKTEQALEHRHKSKRPDLMPSGFATRAPYNPQGSDLAHFTQHDVGTHHNIVGGKNGLGIHTVRPDKSDPKKKAKRLRSVIFEK